VDDKAREAWMLEIRHETERLIISQESIQLIQEIRYTHRPTRAMGYPHTDTASRSTFHIRPPDTPHYHRHGTREGHHSAPSSRSIGLQPYVDLQLAQGHRQNLAITISEDTHPESYRNAPGIGQGRSYSYANNSYRFIGYCRGGLDSLLAASLSQL
jgi:hypothetical protein